jgi:hypothetical protein
VNDTTTIETKLNPTDIAAVQEARRQIATVTEAIVASERGDNWHDAYPATYAALVAAETLLQSIAMTGTFSPDSRESIVREHCQLVTRQLSERTRNVDASEGSS